MPRSRSARCSPMYASWLNPWSLSWLMSVTRTALISLPCVAAAAVVVARVVAALFEVPPHPAAMTASASDAAPIPNHRAAIGPPPLELSTMSLKPRPQSTTHVTLAVVLRVQGGELSVLLWERAREPELGAWALPGGYLDPAEDLERSIRRQLAEKVDVRELSHLE